MSGRVQWPDVLLTANLHLIGTKMGRSMSARGRVVWPDRISPKYSKPKIRKVIFTRPVTPYVNTSLDFRRSRPKSARDRPSIKTSAGPSI